MHRKRLKTFCSIYVHWTSLFTFICCMMLRNNQIKRKNETFFWAAHESHVKKSFRAKELGVVLLNSHPKCNETHRRRLSRNSVLWFVINLNTQRAWVDVELKVTKLRARTWNAIASDVTLNLFMSEWNWLSSQCGAGSQMRSTIKWRASSNGDVCVSISHAAWSIKARKVSEEMR